MSADSLCSIEQPLYPDYTWIHILAPPPTGQRQVFRRKAPPVWTICGNAHVGVVQLDTWEEGWTFTVSDATDSTRHLLLGLALLTTPKARVLEAAKPHRRALNLAVVREVRQG